MLAPKLEVVSANGGKNPIYNSIKRFSLDGLSDLMRVLMESVDDAMFELSDKVENDRERNMYFEAMREIRLKREGLKQHFNYEMQQRFDTFIGVNSATSDLRDEVDDETELTLLEFDDLEDNIAIDNMISKARPHFEDDLFAVTERLKLVLRRKDFDEDENPLDPKAICDSFHKASDLLETDIQVKLIFYKLFEKSVLNNLGHFYSELNELFVRKGVLPGFKPDQERMKQTTRFMANRIRNNSNQSVSEGPSNMISNSAFTAGVAAAEGSLFAALQQAVIGQAAAGQAATDQAATEQPATGQATTGQAVSGQAATGQSVANSQSTGVPAVGSDVGNAGQQPAHPTGQSESAGAVVGIPQDSGFISALTSLQNASMPSQPLITIDPQSLRMATQEQLLAFRAENQHQSSADENQIMDVVSMLFDFFFDDKALPAPIKVLIGRLQIPMLKVAILDRDFFNQKKHPARKLLDGISRASLGWSENHADEQTLIDKIEEIVNFLTDEFNEDISVFEEAHIKFKNFLRQESEEIKKAELELLQQEKELDLQFKDSQDAAATLIETLTDNQELSFEVIDFMQTTWASVLFSAYLSLGESSNHWRNLKRISTTFVWSLIPKYSEEERLKIIQTIPALLRAMSKGMELVKINGEVQNRIFQMLAQEHAKIVKQTSKNIVTRVDDQTVWPAKNGAEAFAKTSKVDPIDSRDFVFSENDTGEIEVVELDVSSDDSITVISATPTDAVIEDLNQFTAGVKQGHIKVDEEIVLSSEVDDIADLIEDGNDYLKQSQEIEIGTWVKFSESRSSTLVARLSWKSNVSGKFVFVNRQGHKVRNMAIKDFAMELRNGSVKCIESASVFDRAINTIMSTMQH